jgi:hypothetical protein
MGHRRIALGKAVNEVVTAVGMIVVSAISEGGILIIATARLGRFHHDVIVITALILSAVIVIVVFARKHFGAIPARQSLDRIAGAVGRDRRGRRYAADRATQELRPRLAPRPAVKRVNLGMLFINRLGVGISLTIFCIRVAKSQAGREPLKIGTSVVTDEDDGRQGFVRI